MMYLSTVVVYLSLLYVMRLHYKRLIKEHEEKHNRELEERDKADAKFARELRITVEKMKTNS